MKTLGQRRSPVHRLFPILVAAVLLVSLGSLTIYLRHLDSDRRVAEARVATLEAQLAQAQAQLTAVVVAQAEASATAFARSNEPVPVLQRALDLVFDAYREPNEASIRALGEVFSQSALMVFSPEAEHLVTSGLRLGGDSTFTMEPLSVTPHGPDRVEVRTRETWVYDRRDAEGRRHRCLQEDSELTYMLRRAGTSWTVEDVELGTSRRTDC